MAEDKDKDQEKISMDDGSEGSTIGYMNPDQPVLNASEEDPDDKEDEDLDDDDDDDDKGDDDDKEDEEDSKDEDKKPDELEAQRKQLEKAYTSKFHELSKKRGMVQMMEKIQNDPEKMIPWLAEQFGVKLEKEPAAKEKDDFKFNLPDLSGIQPGQDETMPTYINRVFAQGMQGLMEQLPKAVAEGMKSAMPTQKAKGRPDFNADQSDPIEKALAHLDEKHEDWPLYEDDMIKVLKESPELINNPDKLYKEGKKKSALFSKRAKSKSKKVAKRFSTGVRPTGKKSTQTKAKAMDFNESWERAKADVSKRR